MVLTTPLLTALDARLQPRRFAVMVRPDAVALVQGHPAIDDVLVDDKHARGSWTSGLWETARRLRAERFDLAVSPHRSTRTALLLAMAGIPRRIGFAGAGGAPLYHERVRRDPTQHDVVRNLALMAPFGGWDEPPVLHVPVASDAAARAAALLPAGDGPLIGLAPGSVWATKRWTPEGFAAVARTLVREGARCVLLGAPSERAVCDAVATAAGAGVTVLAGQTDVATLVAVVDRLRLLIANDSAPMHVACARGVAVVAVFCATTPALGYGPWGERAAVVEVDLDCRPCARHGGTSCPRGTGDCQHLVTPAMVLSAARRLLSEAGGRAA